MTEDHPQPPDPPAPDAALVRRALNDLLVRQGTPLALAANPLVAALLALPLWSTPALGAVLVLVGLLGLNNVVAHIIYQRYRRDPGPDSAAFRWRDRFFRVSLGNSLIWGLGGLWVFVEAPEPERYLVAAVLLGMCAGSLAAESMSFRQVAGFVVLGILPIALDGLILGTPIGLAYGLGMLVFGAFMLVFAHTNQQMHEETVRLRFAHGATLDRLQATIATLEAAQAHLVQADRMASLGRLVGGMAHEINTPLGTALTAISVVEARAGKARSDLEAGDLRPGDLAHVLGSCAEAGALASTNLARVTELVSSFKEVAVDRASSQRRTFNVAEYLAEVLISLRPRLRQTSHCVGLRCDPDLTMDSYPGALSQILTNLVMNALTHAFPVPGQAGRITVSARADGPDHVRLVVSDDGQGIDPSIREHLFEPFVTTNRAGGGSGLGMGIALTQATHVLGGSLSVDSAPGHGTRVTLRLPRLGPREGEEAGEGDPPQDGGAAD